jgi:glycine cleavage system H protein
MNIPDDLRYSPEHEWVRVEGTRARIGITDYAQDALGDIVFVDLPSVGSAVDAVNDALSANPERINQDPYGEGWICEVELASDADLAELLDAAAYGDLTAD